MRSWGKYEVEILMKCIRLSLEILHCCLIGNSLISHSALELERSEWEIFVICCVILGELNFLNLTSSIKRAYDN